MSKLRSHILARNISKIIILFFALLSLKSFFQEYFLNDDGSLRNFRPSPTPTFTSDPSMTCTWSESGNKFIKGCEPRKMKISECAESICCDLGKGIHQVMTTNECVNVLSTKR